MMIIACLTTFAIAWLSYEIGIHMSEEAEGIIVLALIACIIFGFLSLVFLPWYLKVLVLVGLLFSRHFGTTSISHQSVK